MGGATMVCKMIFGNDFRSCLDYITGRYDEKKHAKILAHSNGIPNMSNTVVAQIFENYSRKGGHDIKSPVGHFAYSFHQDDAKRLSDELMEKIVMEHMRMMGIKNTEWILTRHYDTAHEHVHLMFSMVDNDGHVIDDSMIRERNRRICKALTMKYGLTLSSDKSKVNREKLRGKEKMKYEFYDKVMKCKRQSKSWSAFDEALMTKGLKIRFHYNNVTGKLMGIVFTDGKHTFSGKQLDKALTLNNLIKGFGELKDEVRFGERLAYREDRINAFTASNGASASTGRVSFSDGRIAKIADQEFDMMFPKGKDSDYKYPDISTLLSQIDEEGQQEYDIACTPSKDYKSSFISFNLLWVLLSQPYTEQVSLGGSITNNRGWKDNDDKEKERNQANTITSQPQVSKPRYKPRRKK